MLGSTARYRVYVCHGAHCPTNGAAAIFSQLERLIEEHGLTTAVALRPGNCNKLCRIGPSLVVYPGPVRYGNLSPEALVEIVDQHLRQDQPVARWQRDGDFSF